MDLCPKNEIVEVTMLKKIFFSTCQQRVLHFLLAHPDQKYYDREISRLIKAGRASTNYALHDLINAGLVKREKKGRMYFYYVTTEDPIIKQLKITQNLIDIMPLVEKLKAVSLKIVLYGSFARGVNHAESDIDLFVLTIDIKKAKDIIYKNSLEGRLQYIICSPQDLVKLKRKNPVFYKEVSSGMILYEGKK
ncbi:MAG: nucleotidyltransferase domain-containing protein [Candidatus Omnitrophota bacterium]